MTSHTTKMAQSGSEIHEEDVHRKGCGLRYHETGRIEASDGLGHRVSKWVHHVFSFCMRNVGRLSSYKDDEERRGVAS